VRSAGAGATSAALASTAARVRRNFGRRHRVGGRVRPRRSCAASAGDCRPGARAAVRPPRARTTDRYRLSAGGCVLRLPGSVPGTRPLGVLELAPLLVPPVPSLRVLALPFVPLSPPDVVPLPVDPLASEPPPCARASPGTQKASARAAVKILIVDSSDRFDKAANRAKARWEAGCLSMWLLARDLLEAVVRIARPRDPADGRCP